MSWVRAPSIPYTMKLIDRIEQLAQIGKTDNGICRTAGTHEDARGKYLIVEWMFDAGMTVHKDEFQNIIGVLPGEGSPIVCGSHTDTVSTAGKYDGALGVLAGIEAAESLKDLKRPLEVVIFHDEENTMSGSIGYAATRRDIKAFIELHVEQGPVLDFQQLDIGIVEGIVGQRRCHVSLHGTENHAGTTPMHMRDDALVKAASLVTYINDLACEEYDGLVATVGELNVYPNAFSVIPGRVDLTMQVRDLDSAVMEEFVEKVAKSFDLRVDYAHTSEPALCDVNIQKDIESSCLERNLKYTHMPSRASHDAQNFTFCPMGMIFVPSIGGISHSPDELTTVDQCINGTNVLIDTIKSLDYN